MVLCRVIFGPPRRKCSVCGLDGQPESAVHSLGYGGFVCNDFDACRRRVLADLEATRARIKKNAPAPTGETGGGR